MEEKENEQILMSEQEVFDVFKFADYISEQIKEKMRYIIIGYNNHIYEDDMFHNALLKQNLL